MLSNKILFLLQTQIESTMKNFFSTYPLPGYFCYSQNKLLHSFFDKK